MRAIHKSCDSPSASISQVPFTNASPLSAQAFAEIYRQHRGFVVSALRKRGVRASEIDDAVQDVFVTLFRRAPQCESHSLFKAWLWQVAQHVSCNRLRTRRRREPGWVVPSATVETTCVVDESAECPESRALRQERLRQLRRALHRLEPKRRELIRLHYLEELNVSEVAALVGAGPSTVASRVRAARVALEAALKVCARSRPPVFLERRPGPDCSG